MLIDHFASAGTLESSDIMITIEPGTNGIELTLTSPVIQQYGKHIHKTITDTLHRLGVANASVTAVDNGALDCTIKARTECAVFRSASNTEKIPWGDIIL